MPRAKSRVRRLLNARVIRWQALRQIIAVFPRIGERLGMFPEAVGMLEGADRVLVDEVRKVPAADIAANLEFLSRCLANDAVDANLNLPDGVRAGARIALYDHPWIDMVTGTVLLPRKRRTVLLRGDYANWNATSARLGRPRIPVAGRATSMINTDNYFHQLIENGIRLLDMLKRPEIGDAPITLVHRPAKGQVERALLDILALADNRIILREVPIASLVMPDQAIVSFPGNNHWEWPELPMETVARLDRLFAAHYGPPEKVGGAKLFLSRRGAKLRRLRNEAELGALLARHGFETFVATDSNHAEQIARFRSAREVVSVHGAGLTNMLFSAPGARLVEIFPATKVKSPYWWLCRRMGHQHIPVIGGPGDRDEAFDVDLAAVEQALAS